jgi:hypothetical protein
MPKVFFLLLFIVNISAAQVSIKECSIGDTSIQLKTEIFSYPKKGIYFINLHSNETTSMQATVEYLGSDAGCFIHLLHGEVRYVQFDLGSIHYKIDPNRIFTPLGRKQTLKKNSTYSKKADKETARFADTILGMMQQPKLIIAMHNNTNKGFSIESYTKGKSEAPNAANVYINKMMDPDDFVYTTEPKVFNYLKLKKINVVLQKTKGFVDDGSLSVYCGNKKIPYINIEAEEGHKEEQLQILQALTGTITYYEEKK